MVKRHRVVRISPVRGFNVCSICGKPAKGIVVADRRVVRRHWPTPVPVEPKR